ncbi:FKBP-type peptidyl-prolyl cis-trans isomerase [Hymenobacter metallilatus]|uniref:Peptidyl-prolyl cis-trans isomerase n=1 Tax=Hymenobacter metallilatus TaxID=2493666 RepID=A0A3R9MWT1_9BACT|nr:FKBP-type peptidyl-prolyl cis-trans isomerase [Hymenobacter metallilatus]RSK32372.1 FKBP-type peptidyl-prolyl cis-trans isomerase [Hymenobacter metallilatus]
MIRSLLRRSATWYGLCLLLIGSLLSACQKNDATLDTTDYSARDESLIKAYITDNNLTGFRRDTLGLYIAVTQPGNGVKINKGQKVSALYTGMTLDNRVFDSTGSRNNQPFTFSVGQGQVIAGWDLGFAKLTKGAKATLLIPSGLGYGPYAVGNIPANSVLRFDVEIKDVQ